MIPTLLIFAVTAMSQSALAEEAPAPPLECLYCGTWTVTAASPAGPIGERIDFVSIVTRNDLHYPVAKAFLEAGIHVVCEKPLAFSLAASPEWPRWR